MKTTTFFSKLMTVVMAIVIAMGAVSVNAYAAEPTPRGYAGRTRLSVFGPNGEGFHSARYAQEYPDLAAAFGDNHALLWSHYVNYGIYEGRQAYPTTANASAQLLIFEVVEMVTKPSMSEREKVKAVHDWIINYARYDYENYIRGTIPMTSYSIEGLMLNRVAVCQGYAETFDYAMSILGIPCEMVCGQAGSGRHAWNRVFIEGQWLYLDVTWDDPVSTSGKSYLIYDYFLLPEAQMHGNRAVYEIRAVY